MEEFKMNKQHKGITLFGLSGVLLFIFAPILFPIWLVIWFVKVMIKMVIWFVAIVPITVVKIMSHDKK